MKSRLFRLLFAGAAVLVTTACNVDPQQANQAAERVMTVAAQITPGAVETVVASSPLGTPAAAAPAEAQVVYARCITRNDSALLQLPNEGAPEMATLNSRTIITAYGRTNDAAWVLGWNAADVSGWISASAIGCTAPVEELKPAAVGILLTPTIVPSVVPTVEATVPVPSGVLTNAVTATPEATAERSTTEAATETATLAPTETPLPATETSVPTATPVPAKVTLTSTSAPAETATPALPMTVITVVVTATPLHGTPAQVRDLRCEVTPGTPVNLRSGPARTAKLLDTLPAGTRFLAQGRNEDATWLYGFTEHQMAGWLIASSLECDGDVAQLVEVDR